MDVISDLSGADSSEFSCPLDFLTEFIEAALGISFSSRVVSFLLGVANDSVLTKVLHSAVKKEKPHAVDTLVRFGADINCLDSFQYSVLHHAIIREKSPAFIAFLINCGADVNAKNREGRTPLHFAVLSDSYFDTVKLLIESHADVNATDASGRPPLWGAIQNDCPDVKRLLIANGANPSIAKAYLNKLLAE